MLRIGLTGGGTGGHIYPCLAVAEELHSQNPDIALFYLGNPEKLEAKLLNSEELRDSTETAYRDYIEFLGIPSEALIRSWNPLKLLSWFRRFLKNKELAKKAIQDKKIEIVFGTGGYAAGPIFAACQDLKIPYIIHNLDAHMGLANRAFVKDAFALTLGICELGIKPKNGRTIITGNPISKSFSESLNKAPTKKDNKLHILVTGGSQGAESINNAIGNLLEELEGLNLEMIIVTGTKTYKEFCEKFQPEKHPFLTVKDYVHNMPELCAWADLTVCRAGAMTIAEMVASDTVPIFIPLPWAAHDHQNKNAQALVEASAAMSLDQDAKNFETLLFYLIQGFSNDPNRIDYFLDALQNFKRDSAAAEIVNVIASDKRSNPSTKN